MVAARHLSFFGNYDCTVVYPKRSKKQHFINLVKQCEDVSIPVLDEMPPQNEVDAYDAIVDAIFGFSFKGEPREPFGTILRQLKEAQESDNGEQTIFSVDVPSGWNVDEGDVAKTGFVPDVLISLTAPKLCSKEFQGRHFIGGRFLPPKVGEKYNVRMPPYKGLSQVMEVTREHIEGESSTTSSAEADDSWKEEYAAYLAEKERELEEEKADRLASAAKKKSEIVKKTKKKKETKSECTRRLETERKLKGLQKMKSDLWKQRRHKDQMIRDSWMQVRRTAEIEAVVTETSLDEEAGFEEWWKEELTLTEEDRKKLQELEEWHRTFQQSASLRPSSQQEESSHEEETSREEDPSREEEPEQTQNLAPNHYQTHHQTPEEDQRPMAAPRRVAGPPDSWRPPCPCRATRQPWL